VYFILMEAYIGWTVGKKVLHLSLSHKHSNL
jgi:hypothetical protein